MRYKCAWATSALASFRVSECLSFFPKLFIVRKIFFQASRSIANKRYKWYVTKSVYVAMTIFVPGKKKKEQEIFRLRIWACIFRVKWCTVGCIMQWHEVASKPNSSGDVSWEKEIAPLLLWICWLEKSGLIFFYFYICYHAGGSTKHLPRPEVKRRDEESSPKDALTPKEGKTRFAGKMRTYLLVCPVTPPPTPSSFLLPL